MVENAGGQGGLLKDFDVLAPPARIARIGGEEIDVSLLPARVALRFVGFSSKYKYVNMDAETLAPEMLEEMVDIIAMICKKSSPKIDKDYLLDNVELPILIEFIKFVFEPISARMAAAGIDSGSGAQGKGNDSKN